MNGRYDVFNTGSLELGRKNSEFSQQQSNLRLNKGYWGKWPPRTFLSKIFSLFKCMTFWIKLLQTKSICGFQDSLESITTPRQLQYNRTEEARETLLGLQYGYYSYGTYMYLSGCSLMLSTQYCQQTGLYKITWYHLHAKTISPPSFVW